MASQRRTGMALVITLAAVVLLTMLVMAFFSRAQLNRQISFSSICQVKADAMAHSALDIVIGELREEIRSGSVTPDSSNNLTQNGMTIYRPQSSSCMVPQKAGVSSPDSIGQVTIVKVSSNGTALYSGGRTLGSSISVSTSSLNGRYYSRWFTDGPSLGSATLPTWVYLTRNSSITTSANVSADTRSNDYIVGRFAYTVYDTGGLLNANIAGYPTSSPFVTSAAQVGFKGSQAFANLSALGMSSSAIDSLVGWRNAVTATDSATFAEWALGIPRSSGTSNTLSIQIAQVGHMVVAQGDNAFVNRRDLLRYAKYQNSSLTPSYFTTFARSVEGSSWRPTQDASALGGNNSGLGGTYSAYPNFTPQSFKYATDCELSTSINRHIPNVRVTSTFTRSDGTSANVGESLLKTKFPLSRVAGLGHNGVDSSAKSTLSNGQYIAATAATIQRDFGLVWNSDHWDYCGPSGSVVQSSIATIGSIGSREPNFFERLKAGILSGSVGVRSDYNSTAIIQPGDRCSDAHIIQIGVNIIDQITATNYPTCVRFQVPAATMNIQNYALTSSYVSADFFGIKNLPYLAELRYRVYRTDSVTSGVGVGYLDQLKGNILFELWNPHSNAGSATQVTQVRAALTDLVSGNVPRVALNWNAYTTGGIGTSLDPTPYIDINSLSSCGDPHFVLPAETTYSKTSYLISAYKYPPTPISASWSATATLRVSYNTYFPNVASDPTDGSWSCPSSPISAGRANVGDQIGFYLGSLATNSYTSYITGNWHGNHGTWVQFGTANGSGGYTFELKYNDGTGFRTYQRFLNVGTPWANMSLGYGTTPGWINADSAEVYRGVWQRVDPRGARFGVSGADRTTITTAFPTPQSAGMDQSSLPSAGRYSTAFLIAPQGASFPLSNSGSAQYPGPAPAWGFYSYNTGAKNVGTQPVYLDPDGVQRRGDGDLVNGVHPLYAGNQAQRSPVLSRSFYSAGEIGYVYRDEPFKTLDLFSAQSGDAGLLDFFCASENSNTTGLTSNRININSAPATVSAALIQGGSRSYDGSSPISSSVASAIGNDLATTVATTPFRSIADLVIQFNPTQGGSSPSFIVNDNYPALKMQREAVVRCLSECSQTRTWNLLIDVVAQVGRFPATAKTADQFYVEGEKRYWLHVAIDRFTGKIVDQMLEPVTD